MMRFWLFGGLAVAGKVHRLRIQHAMTPMQMPTPIHDEKRLCFALSFPEGEAVLEYAFAEGGGEGAAVIFTHTHVPEALRGRGAAAVLVRAGLDWATARGMRVLRGRETCSYVRRYLEMHPAAG